MIFLAIILKAVITGIILGVVGMGLTDLAFKSGYWSDTISKVFTQLFIASLSVGAICLIVGMWMF